MVRSADDWFGARLRHKTSTLPSSPAAPGDDDIRVPYMDPDVVAYLEFHYPNKLPPQGTSERQLDHLIGQRDVIDHLVNLLKRQQEDALQA